MTALLRHGKRESEVCGLTDRLVVTSWDLRKSKLVHRDFTVTKTIYKNVRNFTPLDHSVALVIAIVLHFR